MRVFAVSGLSKTGKTAVIGELIREFTRRGIGVATVKNSGCRQILPTDTQGDTERHLAAGALCTVLRTPEGTSFRHPKTLGVWEILAQLEQELVILEGFKGYALPKILTAASPADLAFILFPQVFALSGRLSQTMSSCQGLPVLDFRRDVRILADLAWQHALTDEEELRNILQMT